MTPTIRPRLVLVGTMGAGKTTVGRRVAEAWDVGFRDTDLDIEASEGRAVSDIFVDSGEAHFRELEREAVLDALAGHDGVLALGGGAVLDETTRAALAGHRVVFLRVGLSDAAKRVGLGVSRPLLLGNVRGRIKQLIDARTPVYESVAVHVVETDGLGIDDVADRVIAAVGTESTSGRTRLHVGGASPYDVVVGHAVLDELPAMLGPDVRRVALCHSDELVHLADRVASALGGDIEELRLPLPDGEAAKTADVAVDAWERLGAAGFTRSDAVVTVGGGSATDMGGFIAATWLRGVRVVHVPTTLLGMVDAAVGGKTGMNTGSGKNLVGSFHEPAGVVCDLDVLSTLPAPELIAGFGEVVKCGFIADPEILATIEASPAAALEPGSPELRELAERAIQVKIGVVVGDLKERGGLDGHPGRESLNYGHTLAHAVEKVTGYGVRHGEAVALGMVFVAELARLAGRLDEATAARHAAVLSSVGLPTTLAEAKVDEIPFEVVLATMRVDKKSRGAKLRFVVLDGLGRPAILADPVEDMLRAAYDKVRGDSS